MALTYLVVAVPFVVSGVAICLILTRYPSSIGRLYAADLAGAALGCVLLIGVLSWSDGPTAVLWVAWLASIGAVALAVEAQSSNIQRVAVAATVLLCLAAAGHTVMVRRGGGVIRLVYSKGIAETRPLYEKWNSYSRVRVTGDPEREGPAQGWGLSSTVPPTRLRQLQLDIDSWAGTVMTHFDGDFSTVAGLKYQDVTNVGYYLRSGQSALVIGAGGGRDVLSALAFGAAISATAVDINKDIIGTVTGRFGSFTGFSKPDPRVRFVNDEARSFVARSTDRSHGTIQISLIDTWAATAAGAFVLGENSLYTVEAWTAFLRHLSDDGLLTVSPQWYLRDRPAEMYRTTTIAVEALEAIGVTEPRRHIAIVRNMSPAHSWPPDTPDGVGTILVSRRPFTDRELDILDRETPAAPLRCPLQPASGARRYLCPSHGPDRPAGVSRQLSG